jgi:hypothetical protein
MTHGKRGTYTSGCRCDECRAADRAYKTALRRKRGVKPKVRGCQSPYGTFERYNHERCRCEACVAANTQYVRDRTKRHLSSGRPAPSHGASGYVNWYCRCETCKQAGSVVNREARQRAKAKRGKK